MRLEAGSENVVVVNCAPASFREGLVLQVRNTGSASEKFSIIGPDGLKMKIRKVNAVEENLDSVSDRITIEGGGDIFVSVHRSQEGSIALENRSRDSR